MTPLESLDAQLAMLRDAMDAAPHAASLTWRYRSVEALVLAEGQVFTPQPRPRRYVRRTPRMCFDNAFKLAVASRGRLRYVEGYALSAGVPLAIHHAWCADARDRVIETTWTGPGVAYRGLVVPVEYVRTVRRDENLSALHDWPNGYPVLRGALPWRTSC